MDKVPLHRKFVREIVEEIGAMIPSDKYVETQVIADDQNGHYLISAVGWLENDYRELNNFVHIDVKTDAKIWIQHDGTDLAIAEMLVEKGVPKSEIVLGFQAPFRREMLPGYAVG